MILSRLQKEFPIGTRDRSYDLIVVFTGENMNRYVAAGRPRVDRIGDCQKGLASYVVIPISQIARYHGLSDEPELDVVALIHELGHVFGAEHVDGREAPVGIGVPEGPAVAGLGALDERSVLRVNGQPMTEVGVAQRGFHGIVVGSDPDLFVPLAMKAQMTPTWDDLENRQSRWVNIMARLKPGVSLAQAEASMDVLYKQILAEDIQHYPDASARFRERFLGKSLVFRLGIAIGVF